MDGDDGLESDSQTEHEVLWVFEIAKAVACVDVEILCDECFQ